MPETGFNDLSEGLTEIDTQITNKVAANSISPAQHGPLLRKILRTVLDVSTTGIDGAGWLVGAVLPSSGLGPVGDHYVRLDNGQVYLKTGVATWTDTGYSLRGLTGATGATGANGSNGAPGASRDMQAVGTALQTKLSTQGSGSWTTIYDLANLSPVMTVDDDLNLLYRLTNQPVGDAVVLYDFTNLAPNFRVDSGLLQWKLAIQPTIDYQTLLELEDITPERRDNAGTLQWKYVGEGSGAWRSIGSLGSTSSIDGDKVVVDQTFTSITPIIEGPFSTATTHLAAILKGIDTILSRGILKMRRLVLDAPAISGRTLDFNVVLSDAANAQVVLDDVFVDPASVTVSASGVMTWPGGGSFETAAVAGMQVILFSA